MNDKEKQRRTEQKILQGAAYDTVQRYGSAVKEHITAYSGFDAESGSDAVKGLKQISEYKTSKEYYDTNIKQQSGFSAEVKAVARENAEHAINGTGHKTKRTDDISKQDYSKGRTIGGVNDQLFDLVETDSNGMIIEGTARQLKFVGSSPEQCTERLLSSKFDKYRNADVPIEVPKDFYDGVKKNLEIKEKNLEAEIKHQKSNGNTAVIDKKIKELERVRKTKENLRQSNVTNKEAIEARLHPKISTAKDILRNANQAGLKQAATGAAIGGGISAVKNVVRCVRGETTVEESASAILKDTGKAAVFSYLTAFSGSVIKGVMQNSSHTYIRGLAKTNLASGLVSATITVGGSAAKLISGEIDGTQFADQLMECAVGEIGAAMFAAVSVKSVGTAAGTVAKIAAGAAGSTIGYLAAIAIYKEIKKSVDEHMLAIEQRKIIEKECEDLVEMICSYRKDMEQDVENYLSEHLSVFNDGFSAMDNAIIDNDSDGFVMANVKIQKLLGHTIQFASQEEFDDLMFSDEAFKL